MLDVHPPHEAAHTWKDFFIHIATIVIGLLIAVGLEQTVEYVHHRRQTREVRESLRQELAVDATMLQINRDALASTLQQLEKNQQMLDSGGPDPQVLSSLIYDGWATHRPTDDAWTSAKANGSIALIPVAELRGVGYFYETVDGVNENMLVFLNDMETAAAIVKHARSRSKLGEAEREKLTALNASASGRIALMSHLYVAQLMAFKIISIKQD